MSIHMSKHAPMHISFTHAIHMSVDTIHTCLCICQYTCRHAVLYRGMHTSLYTCLSTGSTMCRALSGPKSNSVHIVAHMPTQMSICAFANVYTHGACPDILLHACLDTSIRMSRHGTCCMPAHTFVHISATNTHAHAYTYGCPCTCLT